MDDPFAKQRAYDFIRCALWIGGMMLVVAMGLYIFITQPPTQWWEWIAAVLGVVFFGIAFIAFLSMFHYDLLQVRTTYSATNVLQRGLLYTNNIAWREVQQLSDVTDNNSVVLKTEQQSISINLLHYKNPYGVVAAVRARVPPRALQSTWEQIEQSRINKRRMSVRSFWLIIGFIILLLLSGFLLDFWVEAAFMLLPFYIASSLYEWYQHREIAA
jgi:hypothetical protein